MSRNASVVAVAIMVASLATAVGCKKDEQAKSKTPAPETTTETSPDPTPKAAAIWYRAVLSDEKGVDSPFRLELPEGKSSKLARIHGGEKNTEAEVSWSGDAMTLAIPIFDTTITATEKPDGSLAGRFKKPTPTWAAGELGFTATPISDPKAPLFEAKGETIAPADLAGTWKLEFAESKGVRLFLRADGAELVGRFDFATGNIAFLRGSAVGGKLRLSGFEGAAAFLVVADIAGDKLTGSWAAGAALSWREDFSGARQEGYEPESDVALADKPALDYEQIGAEAYRGKPLIVELAGSWCSTCKRASPFLVEHYNKNKDRGLAMVTLIYEFTDDAAFNKKQAEAFKLEYLIPWEVKAMVGDLEDYWKIIPNAIAKVNPAGFPVTLFVAADGTVLEVHAGFPAESDPTYAEVTKLYDELTDKIVASKGG